MPKKIWYACYGSNLLRERFLAYIRGGRPPGATFVQVGCSDRTLPSHDHGVMILHSLFFAGTVREWENAGMAFVDPERNAIAKTLGRMYLITADQFREVVLQENGHRRMDVSLGMDLERTIKEGRTELREGIYRTILCLGEEGGYPIFTFTASGGPEKASMNPPGTLYLTIIVRGLRETFGLSDDGIIEYLRDRPGIRGLLPEKELDRIVRDARILYSSSFT